MPVDSEQDKKKKESSSPNVTFLCEYFYDLFIVVCVHEIFLKRRLFSAPCVAALVLSDGEQQWGFGQPAFVCFDLNWTREFGSVWRQSVGLFSAWSDWAAIEWHNLFAGAGWRPTGILFVPNWLSPETFRWERVPPIQLHLSNLLLFTKNKNYHSSSVWAQVVTSLYLNY